jgi:hypothetical protein
MEEQKMSIIFRENNDLVPQSFYTQFKEFQEEMLYAIKGHYPNYGDSWKKMSTGKLFDRLRFKFNEFELTNKPSKLISLANLSMLLYLRLKEQQPNSQSPEEMI